MMRRGRPTSDLSLAIAGSVIPPGTIAPFAGGTVPTGWLLCDGSQVSRTTYSALFSAISTTWGQGDSTSTFHLPDLRGRFVRGADNMGTGAAGRDVDAATRTASNTGGATGNNIGTVQGDQNKQHQHFVVNSGGSSSTTVTSSTYVTKNSNGGLGNNDYFLGNTSSPADVGLSSQQGGGETRPLNAATAYIIKT